VSAPSNPSVSFGREGDGATALVLGGEEVGQWLVYRVGDRDGRRALRGGHGQRNDDWR
jgi:hypothetical protein